MKLFFLFLFITLRLSGQQPGHTFVQDTMSIPGTDQVLQGEYVETTTKNLSVVRFFRTNKNKLYLRLIVTRNFYFNKVDVLEIMSGTKSFYAKDTKQHKVNKATGLFLIEIQPNYVKTLRDEGMTGLVFGGTETKFSKKDAQLVKKTASAFFEKISPKTN